MQIETERLILRELTEDDFTSLYEVLADSDIMCHYPYTFDSTRVRGWISRNIDRYRVYGFGLWAVTLKSNGIMIGDCGLTFQNINGFIRPEIGYHINRNYQKCGYATEAASSCLDWAFYNTPFRVIFSYMKKSNIPSSATAASIGMSLEEEYTDSDGDETLIYSISFDQWQALRPQRSFSSLNK